MNNVMPLILSFVLGLCTYVFKQNYAIKKKLKEKDTELDEKKDKTMHLMIDGIVSLQRMQLVEAHDKYMFAGEMPVSSKESIDRMYKSYHNLGGNDIGTKLHDDMIRLPEHKYTQS